jgi:putative endonuclease
MIGWFTSKNKTPKTLGQIGEEMAQEEYKNRGYKIIAANFFNKKGLRLGEIDFIATDKHKIIFVEVKTRSAQLSRFGGGAEAVNSFKQIKILKAVKVFLQKNPKYTLLQPQIDICLINLDPVRDDSKKQTGLLLPISNGVDKRGYSAIIIPNAVEDWN